MKTALQIDISFNQILALVKQLPNRQKLLLTKELEKDVVDSKLSSLLTAFKSTDLDLSLLSGEVESVRQEIYEKKKVKGNL